MLSNKLNPDIVDNLFIPFDRIEVGSDIIILDLFFELLLLWVVCVEADLDKVLDNEFSELVESLETIDFHNFFGL